MSTRDTGAVDLQAGTQALHEGRTTEAIELLLRAVSARPADPRGHALLGAALLQAQGHREAIQALRQAARLRREPSPVIFYNLGLAYHGAGMPQEATAALQQALAVDPHYEQARNALTYFGSGPSRSGAPPDGQTDIAPGLVGRKRGILISVCCVMLLLYGAALVVSGVTWLLPTHTAQLLTSAARQDDASPAEKAWLRTQAEQIGSRAAQASGAATVVIGGMSLITGAIGLSAGIGMLRLTPWGLALFLVFLLARAALSFAEPFLKLRPWGAGDMVWGLLALWLLLTLRAAMRRLQPPGGSTG